MTNTEMYKSIQENILLVGERDCAKEILPALESVIRHMAYDEPIPSADIVTLDKYLKIFSDGAKIHKIIRDGLKESGR